MLFKLVTYLLRYDVTHLHGQVTFQAETLLKKQHSYSPYPAMCLSYIILGRGQQGAITATKFCFTRLVTVLIYHCKCNTFI